MIKIAIIGATGLVGRTFAKVLTEEKIEADYVLFNRAGGTEIEIYGKKYMTQALSEEAARQSKPDYTFFCAGAEVSKKYVPIMAGTGSIVIDNSSAFRRAPEIPLVIPECNPKMLKKVKRGGIVANPNCSTIGALVALKPLDDKFKLKRIIYSTYQAISGAGANPKFAYPIENNLIPFINGEEEKMVFETRKILGRTDIGVSATCIRVPVKNCHTVSINAEFEKPLTVEKARKILSKAPGVVLLPENELPMPIIANDLNEVFIGRIRADDSHPNTINLITVSDNIRKGAATNAVQILKCLMS